MPSLPAHLYVQDGARSSLSTEQVAAYEVEELRLAGVPPAALNTLPASGTGASVHSPFLGTVSAVRELHSGGGRSCVHVEVDVAGCKTAYEAGAPGCQGRGSRLTLGLAALLLSQWS
jgi:hypothetical protein